MGLHEDVMPALCYCKLPTIFMVSLVFELKFCLTFRFITWPNPGYPVYTTDYDLGIIPWGCMLEDPTSSFLDFLFIFFLCLSVVLAVYEPFQDFVLDSQKQYKIFSLAACIQWRSVEWPIHLQLSTIYNVDKLSWLSLQNQKKGKVVWCGQLLPLFVREWLCNCFFNIGEVVRGVIILQVLRIMRIDPDQDSRGWRSYQW